MLHKLKMFRLILALLFWLHSLDVVNGGAAASRPANTPKASGDLIVTTKSGKVQGYLKTTTYRKKHYAVYTGIPFAEKPTGNRRFKVNLVQRIRKTNQYV